MVHQTEIKAFEDPERYTEFNQRPLVLAARQELEKLLRRHSFVGKTVLEVGCGGSSFQSCYSGAKRVILSDVNLTLLKRNEGLSLKVVCDGESLSFKNHSFQFIILFGVLHHYSDQERGLLELRRLLAPGGTILMAEPRTRSLNVIYRFLRRLALRWVKPEKLAVLIGCFSPDERLVDERQLAALFQNGYRFSCYRKFCVRFPPLPFVRQ